MGFFLVQSSHSQHSASSSHGVHGKEDIEEKQHDLGSRLDSHDSWSNRHSMAQLKLPVSAAFSFSHHLVISETADESFGSRNKKHQKHTNVYQCLPTILLTTDQPLGPYDPWQHAIEAPWQYSTAKVTKNRTNLRSYFSYFTNRLVQTQHGLVQKSRLTYRFLQFE